MISLLKHASMLRLTITMSALWSINEYFYKAAQGGAESL
jgi:hypothetical protein